MCKKTNTTFKLPTSTQLATNCILALAAVACLAEAFPQQNHQNYQLYNSNNHNHHQNNRQRAVFARRAADDARPLPSTRQQQQQKQDDQVVMGRFRAPAPEQMHQHRIPKKSQFGAQTMTASFRVADIGSEQPEKIVHGITGASSARATATATANNQQQQQYREKTVGAKIQVSDEGLNYPPSKLSADIYGNVAEIVTAPPEAVENDFLIPTSNRFQQQKQQQQQQQPKARRSN